MTSHFVVWEINVLQLAAVSKESFEKLNEAALAKYPGGKIEDTELEQEHGRYVYQVEVRDAQGVQWDVELDATNGKILQEHRDD